MGTEGIFCANFCSSREEWPACDFAMHAACFECLAPEGMFPMKIIEDALDWVTYGMDS